MRRVSLFVIILFMLILSFFSYQYFFVKPSTEYPPGMSAIDKAALKADRIQAKELEEVIDALEENDPKRVIYGDRFLRWTVLAYTLWKIDQGDLTIIKTMEDLMTSYYHHAWYPYVKNRPPMPFDGLIQYFMADGTWKHYWCDCKPVYTAAFILEYYVLTCFDQEWGTQNYQILKNVTDSLLMMWLPERHQPSAYVGSQEISPGMYREEKIMNLTCSVDSTMIYSSLIASAQIAKLMSDTASYENYTWYAEDLITHFYNQTWDWFPTHIFGANLEEGEGTALQIGMALPFIDGDKKIDELKNYLVENLIASETSWLLKWRWDNEMISPRSVFAAIGLAPKYPQLAYNILNAYAEAALANDPWLLSANWEVDGYEGVDPIWVSGKYLQAYVFLKNRMSLGRTPFSPKLITGNLTFETPFPSDSAGLNLFNSTFPTLFGIMQVKINVTENDLNYIITGAPQQNTTIKFHTSFEPDVSCNASEGGYTDNRNTNTTILWFMPNGDVEINIRKQSNVTKEPLTSARNVLMGLHTSYHIPRLRGNHHPPPLASPLLVLLPRTRTQTEEQ